MVVEKFKFDACIDYKSGDLKAKVEEQFPDGLDLFFDNVGGAALDAALANLAHNARIVVCGAISSGYTGYDMPEGPKGYMALVIKSARMEGFMLMDYAGQFAEATESLVRWAKSGQLTVAEHFVEGLENAPNALQGLFTGANTGKMILRVADPEV